MSLARKLIAGSSLIEVLVSIVVLSVGLLSLAMLQLHGLQANTDAYFRTQASMFAYEIMDRMRANAPAAGAGSYHVPDTAAATNKQETYDGCKTGACNCATSICDNVTLALYDIGKWYEEQKRILPQASEPSTITKNGNQYTIDMRWTERELAMRQTWMVEL